MRPQADALAKLTRPRLFDAVPRQRLFDRLDELSRHPCTWVSGPPGAGKTTVVASWLDAKDKPVFWYHADPGDSDPATFFDYLRELVRTLVKSDSRSLPYLTPEYLRDLPGFARRFFRKFFARLPAHATLVIDNHHDASGSAFDELLREAVGEVPDGLHLIVISRTEAPSRLLRGIANGGIGCIGWNEMRMTAEETAALLTLRLPHMADRADELHVLTGGWAAGVVLLGAVGRDEPSLTGGQLQPDNAVFAYFADEVLERAPAADRNFLLKTACFPQFTPAMARMLAGHPDTESVLDALYRGHYFTERRYTNEMEYRYHDLFRTFLAERARTTFGDNWPSVQISAAQILKDRGELDAAADLLTRAGDWTGFAAIVTEHAGTMLARGRWRTLLGWLDTVPEAVLHAHPWLLYWKGMARAGTDGPGGRVVLEAAFDAFLADGDVRGQVLACAAMMDSYFQEWNTVAALDRWIVEAERLLEMDALAGGELRSRLLSSIVAAIFYRQPSHPRLPGFVEEVEQHLHRSVDINERLATVALLFDYFSLKGEPAGVAAAEVRTRPEASNPDALPINAFLWWQRSGMFGYRTGDFERAEADMHAALAIAREHGLVDAEFVALLTYSMLKAVVGELDRSAELLIEMRIKLNPHRHQHAMGYHYVDLWLAILNNDIDRAHRIWETFSRMPPVGVPVNSAYNQPVAWILMLDGKGEALLKRVESWRQTLDGMGSLLIEFNLLQMQACAYLGLGRSPEAREALEKMFSIGAKCNYRTNLTWIPAMMAALCAQALEWDIQTEYVRWLIRERKLAPPHPDVHGWPRDLEVHTLGSFRILKQGKPIEFSHKAPKKPLALLKAIASEGVRGLSLPVVYERLWPDLEGDSAAEALGTTLHRLRRLLGSNDAVRLSEGRLSLDESLVWVDAFAFERLIDTGSPAAREQAASLYRGNFLPHDEGESWSSATRDRLRARFVALVVEIGHAHEQAGRCDEANTCFRRGIEVDPLAEALYQGVMRCLARQNRRAEGAAVYRQLRQTLSVVLGIAPSAQSERLGKELLGQG